MSHVTDPECSTTVPILDGRSSGKLAGRHLARALQPHVLRADIDPGDDALVRRNVVSRTLPGLQLVSGRFTAARIVRTREMIADGNDDLSLLVKSDG